jgi:hypothetical protein
VLDLVRADRIEPTIAFGEESVVLLLTLGGAVPSEIMIATVDPDKGQILGLVVAVRRIALGRYGHGWSHFGLR